MLHWMSRPVKRSYRSALREEAARHTRVRIRESAARLFVEQGFVATTMKQVATAAGVAERTVYAAFPSKADLFNEALGVATVGDDLPVPVADRAEFRAAFDERDGRRALTLVADHGAHATAVNLGAFARALTDHGALRPGLDAQQAADVLLVLSSPHVHHLLRRDRGWSVERYRDWLLDTLTSTLLPDAGGRSAPSRSTRSATPEGGGAVVGGP